MVNLSPKQAAGLLAYCMGPSRPGTPGRTASASSSPTVSCWCGAAVRSVPAQQAGHEHRGRISDWLFLCGTHRAQAARMLGEVVGQSPGRPPKPDTPTQRARSLPRRHRDRSQAPAPPDSSGPSMPRPGATAPTM